MQFRLVPLRTWFIYEDHLYLKTVTGSVISFMEERLGNTAYFSSGCEVTPVPFLYAYSYNERMNSNFRTEEGTPIEYNNSRMVRFGDLPIGGYFSHSPPTFLSRDIFCKVNSESRGSLYMNRIRDIQVLQGSGTINVYSTSPEDMVYVCSPPC